MEINKNDIDLKACTLYENIRIKSPSVLREEKVRSFRSFVKVINSFENIESVGTGIKKYIVKDGTPKRC